MLVAMVNDNAFGFAWIRSDDNRMVLTNGNSAFIRNDLKRRGMKSEILYTPNQIEWCNNCMEKYYFGVIITIISSLIYQNTEANYC